MKNAVKFVTAAALTLGLAAPVMAQTTLTGIRTLDDRIDDIQRDTETELNRQIDSERFGPNAVPQGWRGSLAFSASATNGSTDTGDISLAARLSYGVDEWVHSFGAAGEYGRTGSVDTKKEFFGTYEANRYFSEQIYAFGLGRYQYNEFDTNKHEAFVGFGPGYRVVNSEQMTWRVQAGPGVRYIKDDLGNKTTEVSGIASSRVFYALSDTMSVTNDTDILYSDNSTLASNDLGLNVKVSNNMSTRFSYRTEYNSVAADKYENKLGVSLVLGF